MMMRLFKETNKLLMLSQQWDNSIYSQPIKNKEQQAPFLMSLETTVFTFKISVPFQEWAAVYDSQENIQMNKESGIICLYKGVKKDDPTSVILIEQGEEGKSIAMFEDAAVKTLIENAGHIYHSTIVSSYF